MFKKSLIIAALLGVIVSAFFVIAAPIFTPNSQPFGYIAAPALSGTDVQTGTTVAFAPWFENGSFQGDVYAYPVSSSGVIDVLSPNWNARAQIANQNFDTGRNIVTYSSSGIPFRWGSLTDGQKTALDPATALGAASSPVLDFIRGDQSNEIANGGTYHNRAAVLGDIIHSPPVYVGPPSFPYTFNDYLTFANGTAKTRDNRLYVGANDGMLHALDAATGQEMFGYIPSMVIANLPLLKLSPYAHQYYVDGIITMGDVYYDSAWHTVLVGGLGAGGKGFYALDVTAPTGLSASENTVASKLLWEYDDASDNGGDLLGYSYGRPSIVRLNSGGTDKKWAVILANGYMSSDGGASLHIRNIKDGTIIKNFPVGTPNAGSPNGLSSPTVIDMDGNGTADRVYAGDIDGNLWKFDISSETESNWTASLFFSAKDAGGAALSIIAAPEVALHPSSGLFVYVATGRLFTIADATSTQIQTVFGLIDTGTALTGSITLLSQTLISMTHASGAVKVISNNSITSESGWRVDFPEGEMVIQDMVVRDSRLQFVAVNATITTGENWLYELDNLTGGSPGSTVMDINGDKTLNSLDNVDGNDNGSLLDPEDVVVGQQQSFGLASKPVIVAKGPHSDVAIINHLQAINPATIPPPVVSGADLGLLGGHFDLDTTKAGKTFAYSAGQTSRHTHQWDDKTNRSTVDYFNIVKCTDPLDQDTCASDPTHKEIQDEISSDTQQFYLLVSNAELSTGAVLELNGVNIDAVTYQGSVEAAIAGTGTLPLYSMGGGSGTTQLTDLKVSFASNAILTGGLVPTATGCVKGNDPGKFNEYRNGAFTIQAVDAASFPAQVNELVGPDDGDIRGGKGTGLVKHIADGNSALLWESTLFWHWTGGCYGTAVWDEKYLDCVTNGNVFNCLNSCWPTRRNWEFEFNNNIDGGEWANLGYMSITVTLSSGATTTITFNDVNLTDQDESTNIISGGSPVTIDLSQASLSKKKLKDVTIINNGSADVTITSVKVNWTGSSTITLKKVKDPVRDYKVDPLNDPAITSFAKNTEIFVGNFLLEGDTATSCTVNTGFDGVVDSGGVPLACNEEQLQFQFDKILTDTGTTGGSTTALEVEFAESPTGTYYWVINFDVAGDDKQVILNLISGSNIGSITGDTNFLNVSPSLSVSGDKVTATLANISSATVTITDVTVSWVGAPTGQANTRVKSDGSEVYGNPDVGSGVMASFSTAIALSTANSGSGPNYGANFTISAGNASIDDIFPSETPVYGAGSITASSEVATALGIGGSLSSIVTTVGKNFTVKFSNGDDADVTVTVSSVTWNSAHNDQQFVNLQDNSGASLYGADSSATSGRTYPINVTFTLPGAACLNDSSSSDGSGDGSGSSGDGSGDGDGDGDGSSGDGSGSDGEDSASVSDDTPTDPDVSLSDTTQSGGTGVEGRLSWREIVF